MGLPGPELQALLHMQFRAQRAGYAHDFADAVDRIVVADETGEPLGRLLVAARRDAIHLVDIALLARARGQGIGTQLLCDLLEEGARRSLPVRLQVRPGNPAFQLYTRLGFRLIGGGMNLEMEYTPGTADENNSVAALAHGIEESAVPAPILQQWSAFTGRAFRVMEVAPEAFPPLLLTQIECTSFAESVSYSLIFDGPADRLLPQSIYSLRLCTEDSHEPLAEEDRVVFLVPVGPKEGSMQYEAVFN